MGGVHARIHTHTAEEMFSLSINSLSLVLFYLAFPFDERINV